MSTLRYIIKTTSGHHVKDESADAIDYNCRNRGIGDSGRVSRVVIVTAARTFEYPTEHDRIQFLIERDGIEAAKKWCARTAGIYRIAVAQDGIAALTAEGETPPTPKPAHYASYREWRPKFEAAIAEFEKFAAS